MDRRALAYWATTGLFCAVLAFSGFAHTTHLPDMVDSMAAMGYPTHLMTIIGIAKLLGVLALLIPGWPLLKEWAYAGFAFNLVGATASHVAVGDPLGDTLAPAIVLAIGVASYLMRPPSRRLEATPTAAEAANPS